MSRSQQPGTAARPPGMGRVRRIHFVGAGGAGMGGIAEVQVVEGPAEIRRIDGQRAVGIRILIEDRRHPPGHIGGDDPLPSV